VTSIDLSHNNIGVVGTSVLADAVKVNATVSNISLEWNGLSDEGDEGIFALAAALKENATVTDINLSYTYISTEGSLVLTDALLVNTSVTQMDLKGNRMMMKTVPLRH
jgi:Ran GTPase-activating protein (RanGAP) involved in mRNA processing and transport